ncbi:MAG TPA: PrsW family intramembrane metalloprotease [Actinomycetota bacterium]|nr:PrsW family intramembrane metalloprotease [Actinomycetota bacterium]
MEPPAVRRPLHHARFVRPRLPAFWLYAALVSLTGVVAVGEQNLFRELSPAGWGLSWLLVALYAAPVAGLVYVLDLYEREPLPILVASFVWGAVAATTLSAIGNAGWALVVARLGGPEFATRWSAALTAPFVEETLKGVGVVLVALIVREELDDRMDGFVYGALCGLGFAVVEDVFYFMAVFGGDVDGVLQGFFVRVIASGLYSHVLYTGLVGMAVGVVLGRRDPRPPRARLREAAPLVMVAVLGHFLWNSPILEFFPRRPWEGIEWVQILAATAVKGLPFLLFLLLTIRLAHARERRWLETALGWEVDGSSVTAEELQVLRGIRSRRAARRDLERRAGHRAAKLLGRLQREQVNLAMIRSRVATGDDPALLRQRALCRSLRAALAAIPGAGTASGPG